VPWGPGVHPVGRWEGAGGASLLPSGDTRVRARWDGVSSEAAGLPWRGLEKGRKTEDKRKRRTGRNQHWLIFPGRKQAVLQPGDGGRWTGPSPSWGWVHVNLLSEVTWR